MIVTKKKPIVTKKHPLSTSPVHVFEDGYPEDRLTRMFGDALADLLASRPGVRRVAFDFDRDRKTATAKVEGWWTEGKRR